MRQGDKKYLLDVFNTRVSELIVRGNRVLLRTKQPQSQVESFAQSSWDRYFTDLSFGSYTPLVENGHRKSRARAWHFAFKNLSIIRRVLNHPRQEVSILDVGCSSGYFRRFLEGNVPSREQKTIYYWGVDIRESVLESATTKTNSLESGAAGNKTPSAFVVHDAGKSLPFKPESFDFVLNLEMLKYLPIVEGTRLIKDTRHVMREDALFVLSMPTSFEYFRKEKPGYMISLEPNEIIDILQQSRLNVEQVYGSQTQFKFIKDVIKEEHKEAFWALAKYHPLELIAAFFAPLYPEYCTGLTYLCSR